MLRKFLLSSVAETPVAIKYNTTTGMCVIGGCPRVAVEIRSIVKEYFEIGSDQLPPLRYLSSSKVRYEFDVKENNFDAIIEKMQSFGIKVEKVNTHGRLLR